MDILKRGLAPVVDEAWREIAKEAGRTLRARLSARRVVDVEGPHGFGFSAVDVGRLDVSNDTAAGVEYGIRRVLPLVELRARFELDVWELDNVARGAEDLDLTAVTQAAERVARFEETAIYNGFAQGGIEGFAGARSHAAIPLGGDGTQFPEAVTRARLALEDTGVEGPFALVLGAAAYRALQAAGCTYPPAKQIAILLDGGPIVHSAYIEGGYLVSTRGGDLQLTLGQDAAIGYETHTPQSVRLYITETFTFRVLEPNAIVPLTFAP